MLTNDGLTSEAFEVDDDLERICEFAHERGWTDGLPIIPPTGERIRAMLSATTAAPDDVVAELEPRHAGATVEKIAINAAMAGCAPEHMPVLVAAVRALGRPEFNLNGIQCTTNPVAPMCIVNGPARAATGINSGRNCLGQGSRANASIGRALRLLMINVGGGEPGQIDKAVHGLPSKYTFCLGEHEESSPWKPLHVELGFAPEQSVVTMVGASSMVNNLMNINPDPADPRPNLRLLADALAQKGSNNIQMGGGNPVFVFTSGFARGIDEAGWDKRMVKEFLWQEASFPESEFPAEMRFAPGDPVVVDGHVRPCHAPDDIYLVVAGGPEPYHTLFLPNFGETTAVSEVVSS